MRIRRHRCRRYFRLLSFCQRFPLGLCLQEVSNKKTQRTAGEQGKTWVGQGEGHVSHRLSGFLPLLLLLLLLLRKLTSSSVVRPTRRMSGRRVRPVLLIIIQQRSWGAMGADGEKTGGFAGFRCGQWLLCYGWWRHLWGVLGRWAAEG